MSLYTENISQSLIMNASLEMTSCYNEAMYALVYISESMLSV